MILRIFIVFEGEDLIENLNTCKIKHTRFLIGDNDHFEQLIIFIDENFMFFQI
jgi:hypothetical protein